MMPLANFLFLKDGFINLDNIVMMRPADGDAAETDTRMIAPGVDIKIGMPYSEVREMVEKLIRDQYEYSAKWHQFTAAQRKQDLDEMVEKLTGHHG
jgi:hypothetical protein